MLQDLQHTPPEPWCLDLHPGLTGPLSPLRVPGKDFLRAAQMNMNFATWGRLMMSILPPCSSLEPLSPPVTAPHPADTPTPSAPPR